MFPAWFRGFADGIFAELRSIDRFSLIRVNARIKVKALFRVKKLFTD